MTKILALIAALIMIMPGMTLADGVLTDGWKDADLGTLLDARTELDRRIMQLQTQTTTSGTMTFTGNGKAVIDGFTLSAGAWAFLVQQPEAATGTTTISEGGKIFTDRHFTPYASYAHAAHYPKGMAIDYITMDYPDTWQLTVVPIMEVASADFSAVGSGVSGFFLPTSAQLVTATTAAGCDGYFSLYVLEANKYRTSPGGRLVSHGTMTAGAVQTDSYLLTPDKDVHGYVWVMNSPDSFAWSIKVE